MVMLVPRRVRPHLGVSKNTGTPNWMVKIMENPMNKWMIWWVFPYFWKKQPFKNPWTNCFNGHQTATLATGSAAAWLQGLCVLRVLKPERLLGGESKQGVFKKLVVSASYGCWTKKWGVVLPPPQIIHLTKRVWNHYFHHPFWWFLFPLFLETPL